MSGGRPFKETPPKAGPAPTTQVPSKPTFPDGNAQSVNEAPVDPTTLKQQNNPYPPVAPTRAPFKLKQ